MARGKRSGDSGIDFSTEVQGLSCGYGVIDYISGVPNVLFPKSTIVEVFGQKSSSKTTLVLETIAFNQMINPNFRILYADFEKMLHNQTAYLRSLGVDVASENFVCISPETMEEGCKQILDYVRDDHFDMIVVDTIAAMRPKVELEKGFAENKQMGVKGKLMSEFLRNLMADLPADGPAVVFINQMYKDINNSSFIQMYNTPSSDALAFYAGIRIEVRESTKLKDKKVNPYTLEEDEIPVGSIIVIKTTKNKVGRPFLTSKYTITFGKGIDIIPTIVSAGIKFGAISNKGNSKSSFIVNTSSGEKSIVGMSRLLKFFYENLDEAVYIGSKINELWAHDMSFLKDRLARKISQAQDDLYMPGDEDVEDAGDSLDLEDSSNDGSIDINSESSRDEAEERSVAQAFLPKGPAPKPVEHHVPTAQAKRPEESPESGTLAGAFKLKRN